MATRVSPASGGTLASMEGMAGYASSRAAARAAAVGRSEGSRRRRDVISVVIAEDSCLPTTEPPKLGPSLGCRTCLDEACELPCEQDLDADEPNVPLGKRVADSGAEL
jgi:hypothetical protein